MGGRGHERPGRVAKCIFFLIVLALAAILWLGVRGLATVKEPPPRGSQTLPGQAAEASGQSPQPAPAQ